MIRAAFVALIAAFLPFSALAQVNWSGGVVYEYDGSGNVRKIGTDTYVYDTAQRLIRGSAAGSEENYTYDSFGNRKACQSAGGGDCQYGFKVDSTTNRIEGRAYDKRGNMLQLPEGNTLEYDELGMVRKENGTSRQVYYIYTADDERIAVYETTNTLPATHQWDWTVRGLDKKPLREFRSKGSSGTTDFEWSKDHVWRDGALLASRQADAGVTGGVSTYHYHVDHLGTPRQVTNSASVIIGRHDYLPFGPELTGTSIDEPKLQELKFTGHERDLAPDRPPLDYMHARYYEPRLGRFLSLDPGKDWDRHQPQSWNMYAYARNNPIVKNDPDGRAAQAVVGGLIGAVVGIYAAGVTETMKVIDGKPATIGQTVRAVAAGAAGGAVSGAIGSTCPTCAIAARGAAPVGLLISGVTGSMTGGAVARAVGGSPQTMAAAQSDAIGGAAGVVAGQALTIAGRAIVGPALNNLSVQGAALRAEAAASNTGLGADKVVQRAVTTIQSNVNAAAAAGGESVNSVVAISLPNERKEP